MTTIPKLQELYTSILSDLEAQYGTSINPLGKAFLRALAAVQAGKMKLQYLALGNLQKNIFVDSAEPESMGGTLERFGRVKINRNPFPAAAGKYSVQVSGQIGSTIKASTTFKSDDSSLNPGLLFVLDNDYTLLNNPDLITIRALTAGAVSRLDINDTLTSTSPISNVSSSVEVITEEVEPLDAETVEEYRAEVIRSYQLSPQGGADVDYRLWSQDAQGVAQVYPYATSGKDSEIDLYVEAIPADSIDGKGTPSNSTLNRVQEVVEFNPNTNLPILQRGRRPLGMFQINYLPITVAEIDLIITGYVGLTTDIQTLLINALKDAINKTRPFVAGADILANKNDYIDNNKLVGIIVSQTPGAIFTSITLKVNGSTLVSATFVGGTIPYLNSVTFV